MQTLQSSKIVNVPPQFRFVDPFPYPADNTFDFEYWLSTQIKDDDLLDSEYEYLPITWTAYFKYHNYGENISANERLQDFLNKLNRSKKYFTIIQFDMGILNDLSHLDIKVFSMSKKYDYSLPLICKPHVPRFNLPKLWLFSFRGAGTHPVRFKILELYRTTKMYSVDFLKTDLKSYCEVISQSTFTLCPRGFGINSFRVQESLENFSIPVIITDEFYPPHGVPLIEYGVRISMSDVDKIPEILSSISREEVFNLQQRGQRVYKDYFTFEANKKLILKNI